MYTYKSSFLQTAKKELPPNHMFMWCLVNCIKKGCVETLPEPKLNCL